MERVSGADPDHGDVRGRGAGVGTEEAGLRTDIAASGISCCRTHMPGATWLKMVIVKVSHDEVDVRFFSADRVHGVQDGLPAAVALRLETRVAVVRCCEPRDVNMIDEGRSTSVWAPDPRPAGRSWPSSAGTGRGRCDASAAIASETASVLARRR